MKYLWAEWERLKEKIPFGQKKLVFLDFDGTLVSIADTPDRVRLDPNMKKILRLLSSDKRIQLVIVSGRPLKQLNTYLRLKNVILTGNHGLEIQGPNVELPPNAKKARKLNHLISVLSQKFRMAFACYPGIWVEDKHFTLSLHYRKLARGQGIVFKQLVGHYMKKYKGHPIIWMRGKKVIEVRPSVYWGKGDMVAHLQKRFPQALPIAIGDDKVDEDMFKALKDRGGLSIRVGYSRASRADYYLSSPYDVKVFLQKLCP